MLESKAHRQALLFGYAGLIPFIVLGLIVVLKLFDSEQPRLLFDSYSVMMLAYLAGIYWAMALKDHGPACPIRLMRASILLALLGWFALFWPGTIRALAFGGGFLVLYGIDRCVLLDLWPAPYLQMRWYLTLAVVGSQLAVAVFG